MRKLFAAIIDGNLFKQIKIYEEIILMKKGVSPSVLSGFSVNVQLYFLKFSDM
jgi:hypothetical protein